MEWTTRIDPEVSKMYGGDEVHLAAFEPMGAAPGAPPCVCLHLACDTAKDVERYAKKAEKLLRNHRRMALERLYEPSSRAKEGLN
jgi:hypothetical protein